jgi:hypothetical protein
MNQDIINFLSKFSIHTLQIIIKVGIFLILILSGFVVGYWFGQFTLIETLKGSYCTNNPIFLNSFNNTIVP